MDSYLNNYGYDQIDVGPSDFTDVLKGITNKNINKIDSINDREARIFNKLNSYLPNMNINKKKEISESYTNHDGNIQYLQNQIEKMEKKNNILLIVIIFLVVLAYIQDNIRSKELYTLIFNDKNKVSS